MARKLAIANTVQFKVTIEIDDDKGGRTAFRFDLIADRYSVEELSKVNVDNQEQLKAFMQTVVKGWKGQELVLEDDGTPSVFSLEALSDMFSVPNVLNVVGKRYVEAITARGKN